MQFAEESLLGTLIDPSKALIYPFPVPKYWPELSYCVYWIIKLVFEYSVDIEESKHVATD